MAFSRKLVPFVAQTAEKVHDSRTQRPPLTRPPLPRRLRPARLSHKRLSRRKVPGPPKPHRVCPYIARSGGLRPPMPPPREEVTGASCQRPGAGSPRKRRSRTGASLLAILLNSRGAQPGEAVPLDRILPGQEFLDRQGVAAACLFERQEPPAHGGHHLGLAPDDPGSRARVRQ